MQFLGLNGAGRAGTPMPNTLFAIECASTQPAFSSKLECLVHVCVLGAEGCSLPPCHRPLAIGNGLI